ncbi:MAG: Asp-tRNA(Asn)/Glu-tRNA(Gln) amidotransferase GatCAB subunit B [Chitinophagaceae bacterium]
MPANQDKYEVIIGLEVHAQLLTQSKLFCSDAAAFGNEPNTNVSPISLAHPGTLPKVNRKAIEFAIKLGLACNCEIVRENYFARKNYFYPDLPKGYQISQHTTPICKGGYVPIFISAEQKNIRLNRIHLEEDAGKSLHDVDEKFTSIDLNRAGTALVEIVTEPDIRSSEEAFQFLTELRKLVRYLGICNGNMEEGSLRCDANISVRKKGDAKLGTKVEVKNLNSIRNVKRAIDAEEALLIDKLENNELIFQQTKSFDAGSGKSFVIREKEDAEDYRYLADADLVPFYLPEEMIEYIKTALPELQRQKIQRFTQQYKLSEYDAAVLTDEKSIADYFENLCALTKDYKAAANWLTGPIKSWLNQNNSDINDFPLPAERIAELIELINKKILNFSFGSSKVFSELIKQPSKSAAELCRENGWEITSDENELEQHISTVLKKYPDKVKEYQKGKKGLLGLFVGEVVKLSRGKADPKKTTELLTEKLKS